MSNSLSRNTDSSRNNNNLAVAYIGSYQAADLNVVPNNLAVAAILNLRSARRSNKYQQ